PTVEILPSVDRQAEGTLIPLSFSAESKTKASRAVPSGLIPDTSSPRASHPDTPVPQSPDGLRSTAAPLRDFRESQSSRLNPRVHRSRRACPRRRTARPREHHPASADSPAAFLRIPHRRTPGPPPHLLPLAWTPLRSLRLFPAAPSTYRTQERKRSPAAAPLRWSAASSAEESAGSSVFCSSSRSSYLSADLDPCTTRPASASNRELSLNPASFVASRLISNFSPRSVVSSVTIPPASRNPRVSPTVSALLPSSACKMLPYRFSSERLTNTTWQFRSSTSLRTHLTSTRFPFTSLLRVISASCVPKEYLPVTHTKKVFCPPFERPAGHSTKSGAVTRKFAFNRYSRFPLSSGVAARDHAHIAPTASVAASSFTPPLFRSALNTEIPRGRGHLTAHYKPLN